MADPIHSFQALTNVQDATAILTALRDRVNGGTTGWVIDEWSPSQSLGAELYLHTASGYGAEAYFSFKAVNDIAADQSAICIWANGLNVTGYDSAKRVDAQPGLWAKTSARASNFQSETTVYGSPTGDFATTDGLDPVLDSTTRKTWLSAFKASTTGSVVIVHDTAGKHLSVIWHLGNLLQAFSIGKVYYDSEASKTHGFLIAAWGQIYANRNAIDADLGYPVNRYTSGSRARGVDDDQPIAIIANLSPNGVTYPTGTITGAPLAYGGTVIVSEGRIETVITSDFTDASVHMTPEMQFNDVHNARQPSTFPNPRIGCFFDTGTAKRMMSRIRGKSRWPNGGKITLDATLGKGVTDWEDSGYFLPWGIMPTTLLQGSDFVDLGTKRWIVFPANRGAATVDPVRAVGPCWRIA